MKTSLTIESIDKIIKLQSDFLKSKSLQTRKSLGQYFTGTYVSTYMASLIDKPKNLSKTIRLLDAGAGTGILTATSAFQCLELGCESVHAVLYEIDSEALINLEKTLKIVQNIFKQKDAYFSYEIRCEDFVTSRPDKNETIGFDIAVINPPYFKYSVKTSPYSKAVADLYNGDPNIYASFMAIVTACMNTHGQLISITPRSFTNGLYFKGFRNYLLSESSLKLIHIFKQRNKVFKTKDSKVLQENVICKFIRGEEQTDVLIRSSDCDLSIYNALEHRYSSQLIIDSSNDERIIRIPDSIEEAKILTQAEVLPKTFVTAGYFISTGRAVEHRTREYITIEHKAHDTVPLYRPHNITPMIITWDGKHKKDVSFMLNDGYEKHVNKNATYVLLKRFSSKDEKRRLVASVNIASENNIIAFGNKTNYIGRIEDDLSIKEAYGLAAIFNCTFMDKYFRCISGNTQVNATEIRVMKFPAREQVLKIGEMAYNLDNFSTESIDEIINSVLGTNSNESTEKVRTSKDTIKSSRIATCAM